MSENENHRKLRELIEKRLCKKGFNFNSSHSSESKKTGPVLYIGDPNESEFRRHELQISQPDIVVKNDDEIISIIEVEDSAKSPKYILERFTLFYMSQTRL